MFCDPFKVVTGLWGTACSLSLSLENQMYPLLGVVHTHTNQWLLFSSTSVWYQNSGALHIEDTRLNPDIFS